MSVGQCTCGVGGGSWDCRPRNLSLSVCCCCMLFMFFTPIETDAIAQTVVDSTEPRARQVPSASHMAKAGLR